MDRNQLISAVARVTGEDEVSVIWVDRKIAKAGLRTKAKRGRGKTLMSKDDAVMLTLAVVGYSLRQDVVEFAIASSSLKFHKVGSSLSDFLSRSISDGRELSMSENSFIRISCGGFISAHVRYAGSTMDFGESVFGYRGARKSVVIDSAEFISAFKSLRGGQQ